LDASKLIRRGVIPAVALTSALALTAPTLAFADDATSSTDGSVAEGAVAAGLNLGTQVDDETTQLIDETLAQAEADAADAIATGTDATADAATDVTTDVTDATGVVEAEANATTDSTEVSEANLTYETSSTLQTVSTLSVSKAKATTTQHVELDDNTYVIDSSLTTNRGVIDAKSAGKTNGTNVQLYSCNDTAAQKWTFQLNSDGTYTIVNVNSGLVLDVKSAGTTNGTNVQLYTSNGTAAQKWTVKWVDESKGTATIWSALGNNLVLDAASGKDSNGTNLQVYTYNGTDAQVWRLIDVATGLAGTSDPADTLGTANSTVSTGNYVVTSKSASKAVDVKSASTSAGATVQLYAANSTLAQGFYLTPETVDGTTYYRLRNDNSGMSLTVASNDYVAGTGLTQQTSTAGNLHQLWELKSAGNGYYYLVNAASHHALAASGSTLTTADVSKGSSSQQFKLSTWTPTASEGFYKVASGVGNSQVLDVSSASWSSGANVQDYAWNGSLAQRWYVQKSGSGYYIYNVGSGLYLSYNSSGNVCQSSTATTWYISYGYGDLGSTFGWTIKAASGKVLDVKSAGTASGTNVQLYASNGTKAQRWTLTSVSALPDTGWFEFVSYGNSNMRLDVKSGSGADGANVQLYTSNGSDAQKWRVTSLGNGYYRIVSGSSNRALTVTSSGNVVQKTTTSHDDAKWTVSFVNGGLVFTNASNGKVLDVAGAKYANGTNVQTYASNGTAAQRWRLKATSASKLGKAIDTFAAKMLMYANDDSHGYDQTYRWGQYGDYDCSSLVITCLKKAGFATGSSTYTGNLRSNLKSRGWEVLTYTNVDALQVGDIILNDSSHVAGIVSDTTEVAAHCNEYGGATGGKAGDQTGYEICTRSLSEYTTGGGTRSVWWYVVLRPTSSVVYN